MTCTHHILMFLRSFLLKVREQAGHVLTAISCVKKFFDVKIIQSSTICSLNRLSRLTLGELDVNRRVPKVLPETNTSRRHTHPGETMTTLAA